MQSEASVAYLVPVGNKAVEARVIGAGWTRRKRCAITPCSRKVTSRIYQSLLYVLTLSFNSRTLPNSILHFRSACVSTAIAVRRSCAAADVLRWTRSVPPHPRRPILRLPFPMPRDTPPQPRDSLFHLSPLPFASFLPSTPYIARFLQYRSTRCAVSTL